MPTKRASSKPKPRAQATRKRASKPATPTLSRYHVRATLNALTQGFHEVEPARAFVRTHLKLQSKPVKQLVDGPWTSSKGGLYNLAWTLFNNRHLRSCHADLERLMIAAEALSSNLAGELQQDPTRLSGVKLVDACVKHLRSRSQSAKARGVPPSVAATLCFPNRKPLPETLRTFLQFDLTLASVCNHTHKSRSSRPFGSNHRSVAFKPSDPEREMRKQLRESHFWKQEYASHDGKARFERALRELERGLLFSLPRSVHASSPYFLWVRQPDDHGEYPIVGFNRKGLIDGPVCVVYVSFDHYLATEIGLLGEDPKWTARRYRGHHKRHALLRP